MLRARYGFSTIEALIAVSLLSLFSAGMTTTLVAAHRSRSALRLSADAVRLADAGMEQLRAHGRVEPLGPADELERSGSLQVWNAALGLRRAEVTVASRNDPTLRVTLVTLIRP